MARFSGSDSPIDLSATQRFFEERGKKIDSVGALGAVLYQDQNPELAVKRHETEVARVKTLFAPESSQRVLDVGCGTGRWALALADSLKEYMGLDFCADFLVAGQKSVSTLPHPERFSWKQWDLSKGTLPEECNEHFNLVVVAGIFLYLNDPVVPVLMRSLAQACAPDAKIYIREPLAIQTRLTLAEHYSDELKTHYSAIYRSMDEFTALLATELGPTGFTLSQADDLYPQAMNNRAETRQRFYLFTRSAS